MLQRIEEQVQRQVSAAGNGRRWARSIGLALAIGASYFLAARLSLGLLTDPDGVAVFWPAAGISAGVLIALGPRARVPAAVGIIAATMTANLLGDRNVAGTIVFALCNAGEALFAAWLIERYFGPAFSLDSIRRVLGLFAAAGIATAVSGIGGTLGFVLFHGSTAPVVATWLHWFASDALGIITVAPLVIGVVSAVREPPPRSELVEGAVTLVALAAASAIGFASPTQYWVTIMPPALLVPLLLWPAARCRPVFAAATVFIITLTIVSTITFGIGRLGDPTTPLEDRVRAAQGAVVAIALGTLVLAALFAERRRYEAALEHSEARLQEALTAGEVMAFEWDPRTRASQHSANAAQILGFERQEYVTGGRFLAHIHPDDRECFKAHLYGVRPDCPGYTVRFRFVRPDGKQVWLKETAKAEFDAAGRFLCLKGLTRDISRRKSAEEHQGVLIAELDHRVKNVLARVAVVARDTRRGSGSMDEFVEVLEQRIQSMADAHALLSHSRWRGVGLTELVRHQLAPYASAGTTTLSGPDVVLTAAATEAATMVLHELVTNAAKYGALSTRDGCVAVSWNRWPGGNSAAALRIEWRESGGPPVANEPRPGYGTTLIRGLIPYELGGAVDLVFAADGVRCTIEIPVEQVSDRSIGQSLH